VHALLGFSIQDIGVLGRSPYKIWKVWYIDSRTIYLKLLLTSFNHVINVMDVYTQSNQKYFSLSGIIKLVYSCFPWKLNVRVALSAQFSKYNRYSDRSFLLTSSNVSQRWMGLI
jgi:hypothetical protein